MHYCAFLAFCTCTCTVLSGLSLDRSSMPRVCVARCASQDEAVAWLKTWTDNGSMHSAMWKTKPGGRRDYKQYVCNAHAACQVTATIRRMDMQFVVEGDSTRQHASEDNLKRRRNAPLDIHQEERAKESIKHDGAAGKSLASAAQARALEQGASPLPEKGVEGELSTGCPCAKSRQSERAAAADWLCRTSSASVHSECTIRASFVHPLALYASVAFRRA